MERTKQPTWDMSSLVLILLAYLLRCYPINNRTIPTPSDTAIPAIAYEASIRPTVDDCLLPPPSSDGLKGNGPVGRGGGGGGSGTKGDSGADSSVWRTFVFLAALALRGSRTTVRPVDCLTSRQPRDRRYIIGE